MYNLLDVNALAIKPTVAHTYKKKNLCEHHKKFNLGTVNKIGVFDGSNMNSHTKRRAGGFMDGLAQGRMCVNGILNFFKSRFQRDGQAKLGN